MALGTFQLTQSTYFSDEIFDTGFEVNVIIKGLDDSKLLELSEYSANNRTRHLKCKGNSCEDFTIVHLAWLEYSHYQFSINFYGLNHKRYNINKLTFYVGQQVILSITRLSILLQMKTFNPAYTSLEISFRFIFLFFAFIVLCWFYHGLRKHPLSNWSIEQKFCFVLLPMLILFNSELQPIVLTRFINKLLNSQIHFFLWCFWWIQCLSECSMPFFKLHFSAVFCCFGLFSLESSWRSKYQIFSFFNRISVYHALRQNVRTFLAFYFPKILILLPIWLCALTLAIWEKCSELRDPTWIHFVDANYSGFKTCFYISMILYMIYLLFLCFSAYSDLRSLNYFDMRLKFLSLLMIFVMIVTVSTTLSRFGGIGIVEDNFVGMLSTTYKSSAHFMMFYGMINFYVITMSYVYSPFTTSNGEWNSLNWKQFKNDVLSQNPSEKITQLSRW